jgi:hypothetical protein
MRYLSFLKPYSQLPANAWWLLGADVCLQLMNAAFSILLNFVMVDHGYQDYDITSINGNRYLAVLLFAYPLTIISKKVNVKHLLLIGAISAPILSLSMLWCIHFHISELLRVITFLWGISFALVQVLALPILMNITDEKNETEAISLFFAAGSFTMIICGLINYITHFIAPSFANINLLGIYCILGCFGPFFIYKIDDEISLKNKNDDYQRTKADWSRITKALLPTFLIAFGAGFTIPFINLFFNIVHGVNSSSFSLMNTIAFGLVVIGGFLNPIIKRKLGYKVAITFFQSLAIFALFVMGASEWFAGSYISTMVAIMMYIIRQPLMNIAAPLTTEVAMKYVGEENRKVVSAITSALWSGSWFLSAMIFSILRELNISYSNIIFTTVIFYILGVISYYKLILNYEREIEPN